MQRKCIISGTNQIPPLTTDIAGRCMPGSGVDWQITARTCRSGLNAYRTRA